MPRLAEQDRARRAHAAVRAWARLPDQKEYRQELQQLPSRIQASGLGQTLAFYASKAGPKNEGIHAAVGGELARFLLKREGVTVLHLLQDIVDGDLARYRRRTREALAYAEWLKRYAAALIEKPDGPSGGKR
jgi:CRISPR-associated protein Cmr5